MALFSRLGIACLIRLKAARFYGKIFCAATVNTDS